MGIDYIKITRTNYGELFPSSHPARLKELSDETGEDISCHHYYYKGLIR